MICFHCKEAGRALRMEFPADFIVSLHAKCKGGTWCDCQHATVSRTNPLLVPMPKGQDSE